MPDEPLDLIPDLKTRAQELFKDPEEYKKFCRAFIADVTPELEQQREARQQSEADAKQRWMR